MGYKRGRKQLLSLCCFSTKRGANKQINNHNGTPLTPQLYNSKTEMAAAFVIALPASHNSHTTTCNTVAATTTAAATKFDEAIRENRLLHNKTLVQKDLLLSAVHRMESIHISMCL